MSASLYLSGWSPPYTRKEWDRCSMTLDSSRHYLGRWSEHRGSPLAECIGWFDDDGSARIIVGQYESGDKIIVRLNRGGSRITFERRAPSPSEPPEKTEGN